ncbi:hypothetical protein Clacol_007388 [Clathrus columnatus]|uniref:AP-3 complex subunit delta n=1 Tax=Clathrus columnatus TaxID=1419009 RepID=A0AAV5AKB9_9AGAM|nr:hypothetical protein Clacol_007388 [Clathrus columnatus]
MWERTLQDLIRGLRANKKDEAKFIARAIDEIRDEVKSKDMDLKAAALLKLLDMLGYDMKWASFNVVEVMSSPKFHVKSVGYLAAIQSFNDDTDVLMLTTNLLKKDLSTTPSEIAITLNGLSQISNHDISRDLAPDIVSMLNHSRAHVRKRAILTFYSLSRRYPEILERGFSRLKEKLDDPDPGISPSPLTSFDTFAKVFQGVVAATVNVLCELALKKPSDYLVLAPQLFHILQTSNNNWMLIKIIKLFGALTPYEPRLVKKLQPPITHIISTTPAISLLYECVRTCILGGMLQGSQGDALARTCVTKLAAFLEDSDQNLKYIALLALVKIVPSHPHLVAEYQSIILASVNDPDITIRMRALELVSEMVNITNIQSIVQQLLSHLAHPTTSQTSAAHSLSLISSEVMPTKASTSGLSPLASTSYRNLLTHRILAMTSKNGYENIDDFEWYFAVLIDLAYVSPIPGPELKDALIDVAVRVRAIRPYTVKLCARLLGDDAYVDSATTSIIPPAGNESSGPAEVLSACAWICGEFAQELANPPQTISCLFQEAAVRLPHRTVAIFVQAVMKVFGAWALQLASKWNDNYLPELKQNAEKIISQLQVLVKHDDFEIQERAANTLQLFTFIQADLTLFKPKFKHVIEMNDGFQELSDMEPEFPKSLYLISPLTMSYELKPVALMAQSSVPVPEGLDLDAWIVPPPREDTITPSDTLKAKKRKGKGKERAKNGVDNVNDEDRLNQTAIEKTPEEMAEEEKRRAERLERMKGDPYYLIDDRPRSAPPPQQESHVNDEDIDSIPVVRLDDLGEHLDFPSIVQPQLKAPRPRPIVEVIGEMPENALKPIASNTSIEESQPAPLRSSKSTPAVLSSFHEYDETEGARTPEPIKVVRSKKKVTSKRKKLKDADGKNDYME